ncbi:type VI secretion system Vgr family protein [Sorangium sp. So ce145]|uniref:type VI secretion system Vgr family protein n=1 Tax=Sorangium sp. So ce145 TaxID=3133285 RepID=UPI003F5D8224
MSIIDVEIHCEALPEAARVLSCEGSEGMNALPWWQARILVPEAFDVDAVIGASTALRLADFSEGSARVWDLLVVAVTHEEDGRDGCIYTLELCPPAWLLTRRSGYRTFLGKTTKEIVTEILEDAGLGGDRLVWRLSGLYEKRLYCVAYDESEWAFIERLLADEGISYWFDVTEDDAPVLVFADDKGAHEGIAGNLLVTYADPGGNVGPRHAFELAVTDVLTPTKTHVREYDVRAPDVFVEGEAGDGPFDYFEYPASVLTEDAARARARVRLEQLQRFKRQATLSTNCVNVQPGRLLELDGAADTWMNGRYLVAGVEHEIVVGSRNDAEPASYTNRALIIPHAEAPFRPALPRRVPRVNGLEPAITTGLSGEEIHVDDLGRVKIRFPWDRSGVMDDTSSYWVRCLQIGMGGSMMLPRVGWEVPVAYVDGTPDRPFVLGRMYNATAVVPYPLPGAQATSALQSATSPGDGTTNEIRMADDGGAQEMFVHASRDQTVTVGGSATSDVGVDETHDVGLSLLGAVTGSQSLTVGADQTVNVGTNYNIAVSGARTEIIGGMEAIKVTANRTVAVDGAYSELIGALYGIQCNQSNTGVSGAFTQLVGGGLTVIAGLGVSETTLAARTDVVGGSKSLVSARGVSDNVVGAKQVKAGPTTEKAGGKVVTSSRAAGSVKVGGSADVKAGGPLVIEAPTITVEAASIKTKEIEIGGGALKMKKGKSSIKGSIKRDGNTRLGG